MSLSGLPGVSIPKSPDAEEGDEDLPNQISAAYEVPQFPIEQIEKKLMLQRHLTAK
jgi:AMP deaminase